MNFDLSDDSKMLRDEARRFLAERCPFREAHRALAEPYADRSALWHEIAGLGWLGAAVPESLGGVGLGHEGLCILAEEFGRSLAPLPFAASVLGATEAVLCFGSPAQHAEWLPPLASGKQIGCLALGEMPGVGAAEAGAPTFLGGRLCGACLPVRDAMLADFSIVAARDAEGRRCLVHVPLAQGGVLREPVKTLDAGLRQCRIEFEQAAAEVMPGTTGLQDIMKLAERVAILVGFEQLGGAAGALDMACAYALQRHAFGRPIGSFQAIKHKLAGVYAALELARSHAYYAAWSLEQSPADLPLAAATLRIAATQAFELATQENVQTHGGIGFTWEADPQLYYRRAKSLSLELGSSLFWKRRLVDLLDERIAA